MSKFENKRGRKPKISKQDIVLAAVEHADEFGLHEVTMAKVAKKVGCTPMALYSHIENHEGLLQAMADHVLADFESIKLEGDSWQEQVRCWLQALKVACMERPWLIEVILVNNRIMPQWLKFNSHLVNVLDEAGMSKHYQAESLILIASVAVSGIFQAIQFPLPRDEALRSALELVDADEGVDVEQWEALLPHISKHTNDSYFLSTENFIILSLENMVENS